MSVRDNNIEKRKAEIDAWNVEIDALNARIHAAGVDAGVMRDHEAQISALRQRRNEAQAKLAAIQGASREDSWEELKDDLAHAWTSMKDGFKKIKAKFM